MDRCNVYGERCDDGARRSKPMTNSTTDRTEDDVFDEDVTDEFLEMAALAGRAAAYTVALCSGQSICPV
jgi:hypothetical protein